MQAGRAIVIRAGLPAIAILLAGCGGPSQPANVVSPADGDFRVGLWKMETKTKAPVVNGATIPSFASLMPPDSEETFCGVPQVTDFSNIVRRLKSQYSAECDAAPPVLADGDISGEIQCEPFYQGEEKLEARIVFSGDYDPERLAGRATVTVRGTRRTGGTDVVKVEGRKTATRLGDC